MEKTEIDLTPFCHKNDYRYLQSVPFAKDGFLYATDSRIIARVPTTEPNTVPPEKKKILDASRVFKNFPTDGFADLNGIIEAKEPSMRQSHRDCDCGAMAECHDCLGSGTQCCPHCDQDMGCEECDGTGQAEQALYNCPKCNGTGEVPLIVCKIGKFWYDEFYMDKIRAMPGVECVAMDDKNMLAFRFDGNGQGLLCNIVHP